jgi:hypothetical protein
VSSYSQIPKPLKNIIPIDDPKILATKSGFALNHTLSARNLFDKTAGKEFMVQLSEFSLN